MSQHLLIWRLSRAMMISAILNLGLVWLVSPWLSEAMAGLGDRMQIMIWTCLVMALFVSFSVLGFWLCSSAKLSASPDQEPSPQQHSVITELQQASVYIKLLQIQLLEAIQDTETSVVGLIECINKAKAQAKNSISETTHAMGTEDMFSVGEADPKSLHELRHDVQNAVMNIALANQEIVQQLSDMFSYLQFQDVLRQRVDQIQTALVELNAHFLQLSEHLSNADWDGNMASTLKSVMESHKSQYVMASQRNAHARVTGVELSDDADRPQIELF